MAFGDPRALGHVAQGIAALAVAGRFLNERGQGGAGGVYGVIATGISALMCFISENQEGLIYLLVPTFWWAGLGTGDPGLNSDGSLDCLDMLIWDIVVILISCFLLVAVIKGAKTSLWDILHVVAFLVAVVLDLITQIVGMADAGKYGKGLIASGIGLLIYALYEFVVGMYRVWCGSTGNSMKEISMPKVPKFGGSKGGKGSKPAAKPTVRPDRSSSASSSSSD